VIRSFRCKETEKVFYATRRRALHAIEKTAIRKLSQLHGAETLNDLRSPSNSLEALTVDRDGQYSIRLNDQYRLCFVWNDGDASNVEMVDYH
jgi:proteic killer suppression protein